MLQLCRLSFFLSLVLFQVSFAEQTIFNVPSADVTPENSVYLEHESQFRNWNPGQYWVGTNYLGYGIGHNTEIDATLYNLSDPSVDHTALGLGFKSTIPLFEESLSQRALTLTVGSELPVSFEGRGVGAWGYAHLSGRLPKLNTRLTAGVSGGTRELFGQDTVHMIAGIEQPVTSRLSVIADWFSGNHLFGLTTAGVAYAFPKHNATIYLGFQIPNASSVGKTGFTFELAKIISFARRKR